MKIRLKVKVDLGNGIHMGGEKSEEFDDWGQAVKAIRNVVMPDEVKPDDASIKSITFTITREDENAKDLPVD